MAVGGEILDGVLFETSVGPALGLERLPSWLFNELRTASSVRLLMADPGIPSILARIGGREAELVHALLYEGHAYDFYKAIEAAKIALSDSEEVELSYPALDLRIPLRRHAFESMIRPELDLVKQAIADALKEAAIERERCRSRASHRRLRLHTGLSGRSGRDVWRGSPRAARCVHRRGARTRRPRPAALGLARL